MPRALTKQDAAHLAPPGPRRRRPHQLHVWLDEDEATLLVQLARQLHEGESVVVRRLIRSAARVHLQIKWVFSTPSG